VANSAELIEEAVRWKTVSFSLSQRSTDTKLKLRTGGESSARTTF